MLNSKVKISKNEFLFLLHFIAEKISVRCFSSWDKDGRYSSNSKRVSLLRTQGVSPPSTQLTFDPRADALILEVCVEGSSTGKNMRERSEKRCSPARFRTRMIFRS